MIDLDHLDTLTDTQLDSATRALIAEGQTLTKETTWI